jgi:hypothetical protein
MMQKEVLNFKPAPRLEQIGAAASRSHVHPGAGKPLSFLLGVVSGMTR